MSCRISSHSFEQRHKPHGPGSQRAAIVAAALIGLCLLAAMQAPSATRTWTGSNTNWNDGANWGGTVPGNGDAVVIPNLANDPTMPSSNYPAVGTFLSFDLAAGAILTCLGDTNAVNADSGGTDSVKHGIGVTICCQNATINGSIDGSGKGFGLTLGGPGRNPGNAAGGSYGGLCGAQTYRCYGSLTRPTALGSAGFNDWDRPVLPPGGGAVRLVATGTLTVNGSINVSGLLAHNGSSGGSVWLQAGTFAGNGLISADGGASRATQWYVGGGGGRIAIEYGTWLFTGTNSVKCGNPNDSYNRGGQTGTVFLCQSAWLGTTTTNGVNGRQLDTQFSVSSNNVQVARAITRFDTSFQWSDVSTDTSVSKAVTNIATYAISGLPPSCKYDVYLDGAIQFGGPLFTGANGVLTFTNTLDALHSFFVSPGVRGTIMTIY